MDEHSLREAISDNFESDAPRLAYANWLAANGQVDRAQWIRDSCQCAALPVSDPRWQQACKQEHDSWTRCRPAWWEDLKNVDQRNDRGIFRFVLGSNRSARALAPIRRLGKAAWLEQAYTDGWLLRIEATVAEELLSAIEEWKEPLTKIPLYLIALPQTSDQDLLRMLRLPQLQGLELPSHVLDETKVANALAGCPTLRQLTVEFRSVKPEVADIVFAQILSMPALRRLRINGHERADYSVRPNDSDLKILSTLPNLRSLHLRSCSTVTDAAIAELQRTLPALVIIRD